MANQTHIERSVAVAFIALVALLLPVSGPAFDHHFFERFAFHEHVYFGTPNLDHHHFYESTSGETDKDSGTFVATSGDGPSTGSVSFFADNPTNIDSMIELEDGLIGRSREGFQRPSEIVIALPKKPPRSDSPVIILESVSRVGTASSL